MKKQNTLASALFRKITGSKKNKLSPKKNQNYTNLVNDFKAKLELD